MFSFLIGFKNLNKNNKHLYKIYGLGSFHLNNYVYFFNVVRLSDCERILGITIILNNLLINII